MAPSHDRRQERDVTTALTETGHPESSIQQFYNGATVFVTGGTGFVGQLIIEKLLRCCPGLKKIYVLARPRKNKDVETRLRDQFKDVVFDKLREVDPNFEAKVEPIIGDCALLGLGISNDDRSTLVNEVNVIFHSAATVRFDEPLKMAVAINTRGTREVLDLATACRNLKSMVHVSTAYSNCNESEIEERFYEAEITGDYLIEMVENMSEDTLNRITPGLIHDHPNTYTFTKKAAEDLVRQYGKHIPCAVVRPSIIVGTAKEPLDGWSGNLYGPGSAFVGVGVGLIHTVLLDVDKVADAVPADYVTNMCIAAAWKTACAHKGSGREDPTIYMCGTSPLTPITWKDFTNKGVAVYNEMPTPKAVYKFFYVLTARLWVHKLVGLLCHWLPAYLGDAVLELLGKKAQFVKLYTKVEQLVLVQSYFALRSWTFHNENALNLYRGMTQCDKKIFDFDFENFEWDGFLKTYITGTRKYLLKDPLETIQEGKTKRTYLDALHYLVCSVLALFLYGVFKVVSLLF